MNEELPEFALGVFKKRVDFPKKWKVFLTDFKMMSDHFNDKKTKPVFTVRDENNDDFLIDVSKGNVNEIKKLFGSEWKDKEVIIETYETEVNGEMKLALSFTAV